MRNEDKSNLWKDISWHEQAACSGLDTNIFYPDYMLRGQTIKRAEDRAKAICQDCPVRLKCLTDAIERNDVYGIQGGTTPKERGINTPYEKCWSVAKVLANLQVKELVNA
jgi:WhiB family redox-sensing transcriptional regulator